MSWGTYAYLSDAIELAQAATVKVGGGTAVMISGLYVVKPFWTNHLLV